MILQVLAVGDVVAESGLDFLSRNLRRVKQEHGVHFTVVNGENAAGIGVLPGQVEEMFDAGADVVTLGNHTWGKMKITRYLDDCAYLLRPANFAQRLPGQATVFLTGRWGCRRGHQPDRPGVHGPQCGQPLPPGGPDSRPAGGPGGPVPGGLPR